MGIAGATVLGSKWLSRPQALAAANLAALTVHQDEEYEDPGIDLPQAGQREYSPGFLASLLLHVPIGLAYLRAIHAEGPLQRSDLAKAMAYNVAFAVTSIAGPNVVLKDKNSLHVFTAKQVGPYAPPPVHTSPERK